MNKTLRNSILSFRIVVVMTCLIFFLVGCNMIDFSKLQNKDSKDVNKTEQSLKCTDVTFSSMEGTPLDLIEINAIPSNLGEHLAIEVIGVENKIDLLSPVHRHEDGNGGFFYIPPYPGVNSQGGKVTVQLIDSEGNECKPVEFTILPLPDAPGAFEELVDLIDKLNQESSRVFGGVLPGTVYGKSPMEITNSVANDYIDGEENENSLRKMADGTAPVVADMSEEDWDVTNGLIKQSGILDEMHDRIEILEDTSPIDELGKDNGGGNGNSSNDGGASSSDDGGGASPSNDGGGNKANPSNDGGGASPSNDGGGNKANPSNDGGGSNGDSANSNDSNTTDNNNHNQNSSDSIHICNTDFHKPDAATLSELMRIQVKSEIFNDGQFLLDVSSVLWGGAGVLFTSGGWKPIGGIATTIGGSIGTAQTIMSGMEGLLPNELVSLEIDYGPSVFLEDDEMNEGSWENAQLIAKSKGWNLDKEIFSRLLKKASGNMSTNFLRHFDAGKGTSRAVKYVSGVLTKITSKTITSQEGFGLLGLELPSCIFGPTDVTEQPWTIAEIKHPDTASVVLESHQNYLAINTGNSLLEVRPNGDLFGRRSFNSEGMFISAIEPIEVKPIEVEVTPEEYSGEPRSTVLFTANVTNANDTGVAWNISPQGGHQVSVGTNAAGESTFTVITSPNKEDYPATVTATSTSNMGLRRLPNAPVREGYALIRGNIEHIEVSPWTACVPKKEKETFSATVTGLENQEVTWTTSRGNISKDGVFTAPEEKGNVTITATSVANPKLTGHAEISIDDCTCWTSTEIGPHGPYIYNLGLGTTIRRYGSVEGRLSNIGSGPVGQSPGPSSLPSGATGYTYPDLYRLSVYIDFDQGDSPLPGEVGKYPASIFVLLEENGQGDSALHAGIDKDLQEFKAPPNVIVDITEHEIGPEPHQARITADITGTVIAKTYRNDILYETNADGTKYLPAGTNNPKIEFPFKMRLQANFDDKPIIEEQLVIDNTVSISCDPFAWLEKNR